MDSSSETVSKINYFSSCCFQSWSFSTVKKVTETVTCPTISIPCSAISVPCSAVSVPYPTFSRQTHCFAHSWLSNQDALISPLISMVLQDEVQIKGCGWKEHLTSSDVADYIGTPGINRMVPGVITESQ